jgi:hypothetical protein
MPVPYPVSLYSPAVETEERQPFVEWLAEVAQSFRRLGLPAGRYLADVVQTKVQLCVEQGITTPAELADYEASESVKLETYLADLRTDAEIGRRAQRILQRLTRP